MFSNYSKASSRDATQNDGKKTKRWISAYCEPKRGRQRKEEKPQIKPRPPKEQPPKHLLTQRHAQNPLPWASTPPPPPATQQLRKRSWINQAEPHRHRGQHEEARNSKQMKPQIKPRPPKEPPPKHLLTQRHQQSPLPWSSTPPPPAATQQSRKRSWAHQAEPHGHRGQHQEAQNSDQCIDSSKLLEEKRWLVLANLSLKFQLEQAKQKEIAARHARMKNIASEARKSVEEKLAREATERRDR